MPRLLSRLRIDEVSSVDRGAGEGVKIMLMKRDGALSWLTDIFKKKPDADVTKTIDDATSTLAKSVATIMAEEDSEARGSLLAETFQQFHDYVSKALAAGGAVVKNEESDMDTAALKKALGLADTATDAELSAAVIKLASVEQKELKDKLAKAEHDLEISKAGMTDDEKKHHDGLATDELKKAFRTKSHNDRTIDIEKRDELPASVKKALEENAVLKKQVEDLVKGQSLESFKKQAIELSLPESEAITLQKAYAGDKESIDKLANLIKAANAQAKAAGLFKEIGGTGGDAPTDAVSQLQAKAAELRKKEPTLTQAQAFTKVYEDPANAELVKRERGENRPIAA